MHAGLVLALVLALVLVYNFFLSIQFSVSKEFSSGNSPGLHSIPIAKNGILLRLEELWFTVLIGRWN